jgi:hypothetical protein
MTINAQEVAEISKSKKKRSHESLEVQGQADCFLQYQGFCEDCVCSQRPDSQSALSYCSLTKLHERVRTKQSGFWRNRWILHWNNAIP